MQCPLCKQASRASLINPYWQEPALTLAHRMNPEWREEDGCCTYCFDRITETAANPVVYESTYRVRGVASGYRYVLSERETGQWNHCNPDLQRWWQSKIVERISENAIRADFDEWFVFDANEKILAQGMRLDDGDELHQNLFEH